MVACASKGPDWMMGWEWGRTLRLVDSSQRTSHNVEEYTVLDLPLQSRVSKALTTFLRASSSLLGVAVDERDSTGV